MFKRFMIGFIFGSGLMYWYVYYSEQTVTGASSVVERRASQYRGDAHRQAADEALGNR